MNINNDTFIFLEQAYKDTVEKFLDDPDEVTGSADPKDIAIRYQYLVERGDDIGSDFWNVASEVGHKYIKGLKKILAQAGLDFPIINKTTLTTWRSIRDKLNSLSEEELDQTAVIALNSTFNQFQADEARNPLVHFVENDPDSPLKEGEMYISYRGRT
jgi:hypothetical protein